MLNDGTPSEDRAADARALPMRVNGTLLLADPSGVAFWPERRAVLVADLHFEKGSSLALRERTLLPPYDSRETLSRLAAVVRHYGAERVYCLGDSFHDRAAAERLDAQDKATLRHMTETLDWIWVTGNHDPDPPRDLGGTACAETTIGGLVLRHEAQPGLRPGEISGHFHPKATVQVRVRRVTGRCFVSDGMRLILPAFGAYTGGLDVCDPAISSLFPRRFSVGLIGNRRVFRFANTQVQPYRGNRECWAPSGASHRLAAQ